jgi:hypothetical protein
LDFQVVIISCTVLTFYFVFAGIGEQDHDVSQFVCRDTIHGGIGIVVQATIVLCDLWIHIINFWNIDFSDD